MKPSLVETRAVFTLSPRWLGFSGALIVAVVVFITYFPALGIGFWMDDYIAIDAAGRISGLEYLVRFFDPRVQRLWYRPMIGMQWKLEYLLFRGDPTGYHLVQVLFHLINCLLLYWLVTRIARKWQIGLGAAVLYASLPLASMAIYWPSVHDPLAGVFYLLSICLWLDYLESGNRLRWGLSVATFVGALLTKEVGATLPIMLFLADRLLVNKPATWIELVKRYAVFILILWIYGLCQVIVITRSEFTGQIGYGVGVQNVFVFLQFLSYLAFPWDVEQSIRYVALAGLSLLLLYLCLARDRRLLFLGTAAILPVIIVSPIPPHLFNPRYLYLPLMASAVGLSLLLDVAVRGMKRFQWPGSALLPAFLVFIIYTGSTTLAEQLTNFGGFIRQLRMGFRPIYQLHSALAPDTYMYFLDTPLQTLDISGLMFLRYGANVTVGGVDRYQVDELRNHNVAYVYYLDDQNVFKEQAVAKKAVVQTEPGLPVRFQESISLDRIDIASAKVRSGETLALILYWRTAAKLSKDYTVFVHLLDSRQQIVTGSDSQPRRGLAPTSTWRVGSLQPDGITIPIDSSLAPGTYTVEVGLYEFATMQRLEIVSSDGQLVGDKLMLGPIEISE